MSDTSWELAYYEPGCYSSVINQSCSIVCAENGFGKARLMQEAHQEMGQHDNLSIMLILNAGTAFENLYQKIRDEAAAAIWSLLEAQPALLGNIIRHPYYVVRTKSLLHEWLVQRGDDLDNELLRLDSLHPSHSDVIQAFMAAKAQNTLARTARALGADLMACANGLFHGKPGVYLWVRVEDDVDWHTQGVVLRELLCNIEWVRGQNNICLKVFVTPANLRVLDRMQIDPQIERINLVWRLDLLHNLADDVCRRFAQAPFSQLVDAMRFNRFQNDYPGMIPPAPGAWIAFAQTVSALSAQYGCRVLSEDHWHKALAEFCRAYRRLSMRDGRVCAFGSTIDMDPILLEVLQVILDWQRDPEKTKAAPRPFAKQILEEINRQRKAQGRQTIKENAIYTYVNRIRKNPHFEPVYHRYSEESQKHAEQHLVYLKNENGYFLDNFDV
jgi:hypothetical protein